MPAFGAVASHAVAALPGSSQVNVPLTGVSATASAGNITPSVAVTFAGVAVTASAGTFTPTVTITLTGAGATASAGAITPNPATTLTGVSSTAQAGAITTAVLKTLPGAAATAQAGQLLAGPKGILFGVGLQTAVGIITFDITRGGQSYLRRPDLPHPSRDIPPAKPFQPVWDRIRQEEARKALAPPPAQVPLPPTDLFGVPAAALPAGLPSFDQFAPPDPLGLAARMHETQDISDISAVLELLHAQRGREAQDMGDALAALQALGLLKEG